MNPLATQIWKAGLDYAEYRRGVTQNGDGFDTVYRESRPEAADLGWLEQLPPLRVLVVAADWCPDVWQTLPRWVRVAEALPGWELRVFEKERYPELMQQFTWNTGAERVPIYAFYHQNRLQVWWSARGGEAERELQRKLAGRRYAELEPGEKERLGSWFEAAYADRFRRANFDEMMRLLAAFYHLEPTV